MLDEGVIKYQLDYSESTAPEPALIEDISNWRTLLFQMGLIGQDPDRYGGLGYGNISCRIPESDNHQFIVSGTQTGHLNQLTPEHFCTVTHCDVEGNHLIASGPVKPSSEAITHGAIYQYKSDANVVIHVHCPEIWRCHEMLRLPHSSEDVRYGTPELAAEIKAMMEEGAFDNCQLMVIPGHEDGVISFGATAEQAGHEVVKVLASAIQNFK